VARIAGGGNGRRCDGGSSQAVANLHTVYTMTDTDLMPRANVSDSVAAAVRRMIVGGELAAGERVNEVRLAERLGVSRTPVREGLSRLVAEGALTATPAIGFRVRPLSLDEFEQLYAIRPLLDPEALRLAGVPAADRLARLEVLNRAFVATSDAEAAIALDDEWHLELIAACPNRVLLELIGNIIQRTRRYELALLREAPNRLQAGEDHERILASLRAGDLAAACAALKANMQSGREPIVAWLKARGA
jgi:DNA-binding GntR family transcriptional regulator